MNPDVLGLLFTPNQGMWSTIVLLAVLVLPIWALIPPSQPKPEAWVPVNSRCGGPLGAVSLSATRAGIAPVPGA